MLLKNSKTLIRKTIKKDKEVLNGVEDNRLIQQCLLQYLSGNKPYKNGCFFSFLCCLTWLYTTYGKQQTAIVGSCTPMIFSLRDKLLV